MKRALIALGLVTVLAVPTGVLAKPNRTDKRHAKAECTALKKAAGRKNFANLQRTSRRRAYGLCVRRKSREEERERHAAHNAAVNECREETFTPGTQHGRPEEGEKRNAFGQCVAAKQHENKAALDAKDRQKVNAAKQCRTEQEDKAQFESEFGTERNAFGKCVSKRAREKNDS
jgi:hypothetical protein